MKDLNCILRRLNIPQVCASKLLRIIGTESYRASEGTLLNLAENRS